MKTWFGKSLAVAALSLGFSSTWADGATVAVQNAWVRATVPGQDVAGAYMEITSAAPARLIKVETPDAQLAEIHSMRMENGIMRMQALESLTLPAKETVKLAPGGYHLMLIGIKRALKPGDKVPISLTVAVPQGKATQVLVQATVRAIE